MNTQMKINSENLDPNLSPLMHTFEKKNRSSEAVADTLPEAPVPPSSACSGRGGGRFSGYMQINISCISKEEKFKI